jgi:hypothetical protein
VCSTDARQRGGKKGRQDGSDRVRLDYTVDDSLAARFVVTMELWDSQLAMDMKRGQLERGHR